ncbi:putative ABC transport system ATP-binding protein [Kineothrix alysoides]|uniref:Putative ABC transport system ATP-binding protein n=1 Tax=Kineothrix alysoides TaxID=1469948 RepID=A0A4R1QWY6_9FIRM|nr:ABC transporter ATP-binding protein [Kineothrix alysoides]TCL55030.1 putative ABC transport system ATP-binding protein [Kineothrix alysoides]
MEYLNFQNVKRTYQTGNDEVRALCGVSFDIKEKQFAVILGPSGSGKSTLLNLLGGMDRSDGGQIVMDGMDITGFSGAKLTDYRRTDVGFVFQFYNLIPTLNAYENVNMAARIGRNPFEAAEMMKAVGLEKRMKHFPAEMSGGELQRVAIARALVKNPKILLCDEPTGALDSETGKMILSLLKRMSREYGKTVVIVTHNAAIAPAADKVIRLKDGKIEGIQVNDNPISMEQVVW